MLTIVIASYNHEKYIESCMLAVLGLEWASVIVIDDGSTDATAEIVQSFLKKHNASNISLIQKDNSGLVSSLNLGLSLARTEYFYLVASDDIPDKDGLLQCIEKLENNKRSQFCIGGARAFNDEDEGSTYDVYGKAQESFLKLKPSERSKASLFNYPVPLLLQSTVFRVSALKDIGGWDSNVVLDDYPMFVRLLSVFSEWDRDFLYAPEVDVVKYRQHPHNSFRNLLRQYTIVAQAIRSIAKAPLSEYAVSKMFAYYSIVAIKNRQFEYIKPIFKASSGRVIVSSIYYFFNIPLSRLLTVFRSYLKSKVR